MPVEEDKPQPIYRFVLFESSLHLLDQGANSLGEPGIPLLSHGYCVGNKVAALLDKRKGFPVIIFPLLARANIIGIEVFLQNHQHDILELPHLRHGFWLDLRRGTV